MHRYENWKIRSTFTYTSVHRVFYKSRFLCWRRYNDSGLWCTMMGWMAAHNSGRQLTTINIMQLSLEVVVDRTISCTLILSLSLSLPLSHTYILYCHSIILHPLPLFLFTHKKSDGRLSKFSLKSMNLFPHDYDR